MIPESPQSRLSVRWQLLLLALLWTLLNCVKPVHIDDPSYLQCAREFAHHPLDPYAFELNWDQWPEPAIWFTSPAVLIYWLAPAARWFYDHPFIIKLWMLPFAWMFLWGFHRLCTRFVGSHELLLTGMTVFSAAFLPGMNLMLDIPALAIFLISVEVMFRALDRNSTALAVVAGTLAALAIETKYTLLAAPAVLLMAALFARRVRLGAIAFFAAALLVFAWEAFLAHRYGQSQFIAQLAINDPRRRIGLSETLLGLPPYFAAPVPFLFVLSAVALRVRGWTIAALAMLVAIAVLITIDPLFTVLSVVLALMCGLVLLRAIRAARRETTQRLPLLFLVAWLLIEIASTCAISPFPAVRRWYGVAIVLTFIVGRVAFRDRIVALRAWPMRVACAACVGVAIVFYVSDFEEALVRKNSIERAAAMIRQRDPNATIWLIGHWGPEYYGQRAGMQSLAPDESIVHAGDWLVAADGVHTQQVAPPAGMVVAIDGPVTPYHLRWSTARSFYGGIVPMTWHRPISDELPIAGVQPIILRITRDGVLPSAFSLDDLIIAATERRTMVPRGLVRAIEQFATSRDEQTSRKAREFLARTSG